MLIFWVTFVGGLISIGWNQSVQGQVFHLRAREGTFYSPNYPTPYPISNVEWIIRLPDVNNRVFLRLTAFNLQPTYSSLEIRNGPNSTSPLLATFTGSSNTLPLDVSSSSNEINVRFRSSRISTYTGFFAEYYSITGETQYAENVFFGELKSSNYPQYYNNNEFYRFVIAGSEEFNLVDLNFFYLQTEECCDNVEVRDGSGIIGTFSGSVLPPRIISTNKNATVVRLYSDSSITAQGFLAKYQRGKEIVLTRNTGEVVSPNYPQNYTNSRTDQWIIETKDPLKPKIQLFFKTFLTEANYDTLHIYDGGNDTSPLLGIHSGTVSPPPYVSTGRLLFLRFGTDSIIARTGFHAHYEAVSNASISSEPMHTSSDQQLVPNHKNKYFK